MNSEYEPFYCSANDGLRLFARKYGWHNDDPNPVVCLAGITRNSADYHELAMFLASEPGGNRRVFAIDYRGRGQSDYDKNGDNYNIATEAEDVIAMVTAAGIGHLNIIGTSRGGLIAMIMATTRPGIIKSVVLNDIGPVVDARGIIRVAKSLENFRRVSSWQQAEDNFYLYGKTHYPDLSEEEWRKEAHWVYRQEKKKIVPQYDPKILKALQSINLNQRIPDMWQEFAALSKFPMMVIRGSLSDMLSEETLEQMQAFNEDLNVVIAENQGHAPRLATPAIASQIAKFIK